MKGAEERHLNDLTTTLQEALSETHNEELEALVTTLYEELRTIAHQRLKYERSHHTLNTTALVHEAYENLSKREVEWKSKQHFLATASKVMRHVLINYAEKKNAQKRGGKVQTLSLDIVPDAISEERAEMLLGLDEALQRLAKFDPRGAQIVEYRFFGGLNQSEIATLLGVTERTVHRAWVMAKTWIKQEMKSQNLFSD